MYKEVGYFDEDYKIVKRLSYCKGILITIHEYNPNDETLLSKKTEYVDDKIIITQYDESPMAIHEKETFKNNELIEKIFFNEGYLSSINRSA